MKNNVLEILKGIRPDIDFSVEKELLTQEIWDSFDIISVIAELTEAFSIEIEMEDVTEENFNSVEGIISLIERKAVLS